MKRKILNLKIWLKERTFTEKIIIHIGLFPFPALFLIFTFLVHGDINNN